MEPKVVSSFFPYSSGAREKSDNKDICDDFLHLIDELNSSLDQLQLPESVKYIYNPTIYARHTFEMYVRKYCNTKKKIMYFGMNPGPWGMSQTGVPFGEIKSVRDWLQIQGPVDKPPKEVPARPVQGFDCTRTEVSGKRFWGIFRDICKTPDKFFETSFVFNYLPQQWLKSNGCNLTPGDFKTTEMKELYKICDPIFGKVLEIYEVEKIVAIGKFCEKTAQRVMKTHLSSRNIEVLYLSHPSPRAVNNNNWGQKALEWLADHNMLQYYT